MNTSYLYSARRRLDPTQLSLLVVPDWMFVSLKAQGLTVDQAWDANCGSFGSIFSDKDVMFHDEVSYRVNELLFGSDSLSADKVAYQEQFKQVCESWFAIPFETKNTLNLHPVVLSSNTIALINHKGNDADKVCATDIYERILQCIHRLVVSQVGTQAWNSEFVRAVFEKIRVRQLAA